MVKYSRFPQQGEVIKGTKSSPKGGDFVLYLLTRKW